MDGKYVAMQLILNMWGEEGSQWKYGRRTKTYKDQGTGEEMRCVKQRLGPQTFVVKTVIEMLLKLTVTKNLNQS